MKKWKLQNELEIKNENLITRDLINLLLNNRGIKTKKEIDEYLNPKLKSLTAESLGINKKDLEKSVDRIKKAIKNKEQIIVFGDYDVDGISGSAILWESLNSLGANIMPYIPHRVEEGYGLSIKGLELVLKKYPEAKLIITVDNGIVANEAVDFGNSLGLEIIITDHHATAENLPKAFSIIHSTKICGAGVGWFLSRVILNSPALSEAEGFQDLKMSKQVRHDIGSDHLGLVALATVTDVMQLNGFNRTLVKIGLENLRKTKRPGIIELLKLAGVDQEKIGVYELGHIIGPRLNAMGRIEHAMDSLRFLCTPNLTRAKELANLLHLTNRDRQQLTMVSVINAKNSLSSKIEKLIFISDKSLQPGIIGLVSGRLTEEFYRPSVVISVGEEFSKGSARSVSGFNIIEFIRQFSDLLVDKGGHPMAAGFTLKTKDLEPLQKKMIDAAKKKISEKLLIRELKIDCQLPVEFINLELFQKISKLSPFGYGNPEPLFLAKDLRIENMHLVGVESKHLKLQLIQLRSDLNTASNQGRTLTSIGGIMFGYDKSLNLKVGDEVDAVYTISLNEWNGNKKVELKIKDIKKS